MPLTSSLPRLIQRYTILPWDEIIVVLADTVGFVRNLPRGLVESKPLWKNSDDTAPARD